MPTNESERIPRTIHIEADDDGRMVINGVDEFGAWSIYESTQDGSIKVYQESSAFSKDGAILFALHILKVCGVKENQIGTFAVLERGEE